MSDPLTTAQTALRLGMSRSWVLLQCREGGLLHGFAERYTWRCGKCNTEHPATRIDAARVAEIEGRPDLLRKRGRPRKGTT